MRTGILLLIFIDFILHLFFNLYLLFYYKYTPVFSLFLIENNPLNMNIQDSGNYIIPYSSKKMRNVNPKPQNALIPNAMEEVEIMNTTKGIEKVYCDYK